MFEFVKNVIDRINRNELMIDYDKGYFDKVIEFTIEKDNKCKALSLTT